MANDTYNPPPAGANDGVHMLQQMDTVGAVRDMLFDVFGEDRARQMLADQAERKQLINDLNKMNPEAFKRFHTAHVRDQHGVAMKFAANNDVEPSLHELRMLFYAVKDEQRHEALFAHMSPAERARFIAQEQRHNQREKSRVGRLANDAIALGSHALEAVRLAMEIAPRAQFAELITDWRSARELTVLLRAPDEDGAGNPAPKTPTPRQANRH